MNELRDIGKRAIPNIGNLLIKLGFEKSDKHDNQEQVDYIFQPTAHWKENVQQLWVYFNSTVIPGNNSKYP